MLLGESDILYVNEGLSHHYNMFYIPVYLVCDQNPY